MDDLIGLLSGGGQLASALIPYNISEENIEFLRGRAPQYAQQATGVGETAAKAAQFTPFTVTTGTGTTQVGAGGDVTQTLGATPAQIQAGLLGQAQTGVGGLGAAPTQYGDIQQQALTQAASTLGQATPTAESLFQQLQAIQAPEQERQRLALENRLAAQGRLGTQTSMFGGTPEALALEKAIQEQQAASAFQAQQLAPQLAAQQLQQATGLFGLGAQAGLSPAQQQAAQLANIQSTLGTAFLPQQQQLQELQAATNLANIRQSAGLGQAEALYRGGIAGLEAQAAADTSVAALEAARVRALADALGSFFGAGATTAASGATSPFEQLAESLTGLFGNDQNSAYVSPTEQPTTSPAQRGGFG